MTKRSLGTGLIKCFFITGLLLPLLLVAKIESVHANEANELKVIAEANKEQPIVEVKAKAETPRLQNDANVNNKTSIKMIVGGQSQDGVAKSINLPINAR